MGALAPFAAAIRRDPAAWSICRTQLNACEQAGIAAEQANGLPAGLLLAIGRVESGRWDPARGRMTSWPWTINAAGRGQWFGSKDAAVQTVKTLLDGGTRSIDVGCFQINLMWHPTAFASLEQAFDPVANANYAARFLLGLYGQTGSWEAAVQAYHSADPALGFAYRQQVFATWSAAASDHGGGELAGQRRHERTMLAAVPRPPAMPIPMVIAGVQIWTPMPIGTAARGRRHARRPSRHGQPPPGNRHTTMGPPLPVVSYRVMPRR